MGIIQGHLGEQDKLISILKAGYKPASKANRKPLIDIVAIERFKQSDGHYIYLSTPIPPNIARQPEKLKAYLDDNRRKKGHFQPTSHQYDQGIKYSGSDPTKPGARAKAIPDYTDDISGNLAHKTMPRIKRIIRQAEAANIEFLKDLI